MKPLTEFDTGRMSFIKFRIHRSDAKFDDTMHQDVQTESKTCITNHTKDVQLSDGISLSVQRFSVVRIKYSRDAARTRLDIVYSRVRVERELSGSQNI